MSEKGGTDRAWQLIAGFADGELSPAECEELEKALLENQELLQEFVLYMELHSRVVWDTRARSDAIDDRIVPDMDEAVAASDQSVAIRIRQAVQFMLRPTPLSMTVATLVVGLLVTAMYFVIMPAYRLTAERDPDAPVQTYEFVARLTGTHDATWGQGQVGTQRGAHLMAGHRMVLKTGLAEITYDSGTRVTLQGPAEFVVSGPNAAALADGRLSALVTKESQGFVVDTRVARIVDLGTEFGVAMDDETNLELHVFQGEVMLEPSEVPRKRQIVRAGQAVVLSAGGKSIDKPANPKQFVSRLPTLEEDYAPPTEYTKLVLSQRPSLYYRMEPSRPGVLFDSGRWAMHGELRRSGAGESPFEDGVDGGSLLLRGSTGGNYGIVAPYSATANDQVSVAAWVNLDQHSGWGLITANWGERRVGQFHFGQYHNGGNLSVSVTQASGAITSVREGQPLPLKTWQHVAFVVDGERVTLYRNGERVADGACRGILAQSPVPALGIGGKTNDAGTAASLGTLWHGRIDELAVFPRALSAEAIRELSQTPPPAKTEQDNP